jgi:hypothetical protein
MKFKLKRRKSWQRADQMRGLYSTIFMRVDKRIIKHYFPHALMKEVGNKCSHVHYCTTPTLVSMRGSNDCFSNTDYQFFYLHQ